MLLGGVDLLRLIFHPGHAFCVLTEATRCTPAPCRGASSPPPSPRFLFFTVCLAKAICQMSISFMNSLVPQETTYFMVNLLFTKKMAQL